MAKRVGVDKSLFSIVLALVLFGLVMVFSASAVLAQERYGTPFYFVNRQMLWVAMGLIAMLILMRIDYRRYNSPRVVFPVVGGTALLLIIVFAMRSSHNTHRWIALGPLGTMQPSEFAKPVLVLFIAWFLQSRIHLMDDWRGTVLPAAAPSLVFTALIVLEPDLGTAIVCFAVTAFMLYLAGLRLRYFALAAAVAAPVLYLLLFRVAWRRARMLVFLHPDSDPQGAGFHIHQSLLAVSTGGVTGHGLMEGVAKLFYLPEPHTDFIYANICEELGLIGAIAVLGIFAYFGYRGMRAAILSTDPFARFLAFGITATIVIQALFNMSVVLDLLPTKGIPLPLISFGGTAVFVTLASIGVLLNITRAVD
jgi:cell division protein FtsW